MPSRFRARCAATIAIALIALGAPASPGVVNGEDVTDPGRYPWMVGLLTAGEEDRAQAQFCGGSLIAPEWVLTAAHCLFGDSNEPLGPGDIEALLGTVDLSAGDGTVIDIVEVIVHEAYDDETIINDIGLIRLGTPQSTGVVSLIEGTLLEAAGTTSTVIGWGGTLPDPTGDLGEDQVFEPQLRQGTFPILDDASCLDEVGGFEPDTQLCAGSPAPAPLGGIDSCQGDSGGPLVVESEGDDVLVGLVSYGELCGITYGVYTQLSAYRTWVFEKSGVGAPDGGEEAGELDRYAGANRFATAADLAINRFDAPVDVLYVVTGTSFPDALAVAPVAGADAAPVLLVQRDAIPSETAAALTALAPSRIVIAGGAGAVSDAVAAELASYADSVDRVAGPSRYETAASLSARGFPAGADAVLVASGASFADALGGAAAAANAGLPLLLVAPDSLPVVTEDELNRLAPATVFVLGGTGAVGDAVIDALGALGFEVVRIAGASRYATSAAVVETFFADATEVIVATGLNFPDGLVAGSLGSPLLLLPAGRVPSEVLDEVRRLQPSTITVMGGSAAVTAEQGNELVAAAAG